MARGDRSARPRESLRAWSLALLLICACRVDSAGLGAGTDDGGTGGTGGAATGIGGTTGGTGAGGAGGRASGVAGAGATTGAAGATGTAGAGGTGGDPIPIAGAGGAGPIGGTGDDGTAGAGGLGGLGGTSGGGTGGEGARGGAGGAAGTGAAGTAGTGGAGDTGGRGGTAGTGTGGRGGAGGGCGVCPACTRCTSGACTPDPASLWKLWCVRAAITQTKPTGASWDAVAGTAAAPDPKCAFWLGNSSASETSTLSDTFMPEWNESITPGSRFTASLLSSQSSPWSIRVTDEDPLGSDAICSISPALDAATFVFGSVTFASGSCSSLEIGLECVSQ